MGSKTSRSPLLPAAMMDQALGALFKPLKVMAGKAQSRKSQLNPSPRSIYDIRIICILSVPGMDSLLSRPRPPFTRRGLGVSRISAPNFTGNSSPHVQHGSALSLPAKQCSCLLKTTRQDLLSSEVLKVRDEPIGVLDLDLRRGILLRSGAMKSSTESKQTRGEPLQAAKRSGPRCSRNAEKQAITSGAS